MNQGPPASFYQVKVRINQGHYEPIGAITGTLQHAQEERARLMKLTPFRNAWFSIWVLEPKMCGEEKQAK
jgi:hypothetical protein